MMSTSLWELLTSPDTAAMPAPLLLVIVLLRELCGDLIVGRREEAAQDLNPGDIARITVASAVLSLIVTSR